MILNRIVWKVVHLMHDDAAGTLEWSYPGTPISPVWTLNWQEIENAFPWLESLHGVEQEPDYHAEGDVWTHTHMVAESMIGNQQWKMLSSTERAISFVSALLHDIGKPGCTHIDSEGHISSPGHARVGSVMTHTLLWNEASLNDILVPFACRETIARRIRHHGLPLWFWDKANPARAVIMASQVVRLDRVALLAEADVRGRICEDQANLLERIALFREFCQEQGCYEHPYPFANGLARFIYCRTPDRDPAYVPYDDTTCEVILMSGLPASGKDTWIRVHAPDLPVISLDAIRAELKVEPTEDQGSVIHLARERVREFLRRQQSFIWNATNITRQLRAQLIDLFAAYHARVRIVYREAPASVLFARNRSRDRFVPESILLHMLSKLEVPDITEAHIVEWSIDESNT
jgi:predicted kinase